MAGDEQEHGNADVVRRYFRTFATKNVDDLREVVAEDVVIFGSGVSVQGRRFVEDAVLSPGLTVIDQEIVELFAAADRVTLVAVNTYRRDSTGATAAQSVCKMYRVAGGRIVQFWGEQDLFGLLRDLQITEPGPIEF